MRFAYATSESVLLESSARVALTYSLRVVAHAGLEYSQTMEPLHDNDRPCCPVTVRTPEPSGQKPDAVNVWPLTEMTKDTPAFVTHPCPGAQTTASPLHRPLKSDDTAGGGVGGGRTTPPPGGSSGPHAARAKDVEATMTASTRRWIMTATLPRILVAWPPHGASPVGRETFERE